MILQDDMLELRTHPRDDSGISLWDWSQKQFGDSGFMIDYVIEVPEALQNIRIKNDVGKVRVNELKGLSSCSWEPGKFSSTKRKSRAAPTSYPKRAASSWILGRSPRTAR